MRRHRLFTLCFLVYFVVSFLVSPVAFAVPASSQAQDTAGTKKVASAKNKATGKASSSKKRSYAADEVIVKFKPSTGKAKKESIKSRAGLKSVKRFSSNGSELVKLGKGKKVLDMVKELEKNPDVLYAQPNYVYYPLATVNDPNFGDLWGLDQTNDIDMDVPAAWDTTQGNSQVVVAVIDTGVDIDHPDLADNIWTNTGETPDNGLDDDGNGYVDDIHGWDFYNGDNTVFDPWDGDEHGTHVAGTIAAVANNSTGVVGVAPNVKIMPLKFIGPDGGYTSDAIDAIDYAKQKGIKISNNSWGGGAEDPALSEAINSSGMVFVAAAGNGDDYGNAINNDLTPFFPASYGSSNIISVAAVNSTGGLASFSNYGATSVDVGAPGVDIYSLKPVYPGIGAAVLATGSPSGNLYKAIHMGVGMEDFPDVASRAAVMQQMLTALDTDPASPILIVDDDNSEAGTGDPNYRQELLDGLAGYTNYTVVEAGDDVDGPNASAMSGNTVIWFTGAAYGYDSDYNYTLSHNDLTNLQTFLENGGRLLLIGEDLAYNVFNPDWPVYYNLRTYFFTNYLKETIHENYTPTNIFQGVDEYTGVYHLGYNEYRDSLQPLAGSTSIFEYAGTDPAPAYQYMDGTSMAAPHVAGVAALMLSEDAALTPAEVIDIIKSTATPLESLNGKTVSGGMANANNAIQYVNSVPKLNPDDTDNTPANQVEITFDSNLSWVGAITEVKVDDINLADTDYTVTDGQLTIAAGVAPLNTVGLHEVVVIATGYRNKRVIQGIWNTAPELLADTELNYAGNYLEIKYIKDEAWKNAITEVRVDGRMLTKYTDYYLITYLESAYGGIDIEENVINEPGSHLIEILAQGYVVARVTQEILPALPPWVNADWDEHYLGNDIDLTFESNSQWEGSVNGITVDGTPLNGSQYSVTSGNIRINAGVFTTTDKTYTIVISATGYTDATVEQYISLRTPPVLTPDSTANIVGNAIDLTFMPNEQWQNAITAVKFNGVGILEGDYTITAGNIHIKEGVLNVSGDCFFIIYADGYSTAWVDQKLWAQPSPPDVNPVFDSVTAVTGNAESGSTVKVKKGSTVIGSALAALNGNFSVTIPKQTAGTVLSVTATNGSGLESLPTTVTVIDKTPPTVTANLASGSYNVTKTVTLTANEQATIYYTIDGTTPTIFSTVYSGSITISATTTLKFYGRDTAGNSSAVTTKSYVIDKTPPTVTANLASGLYNTNKSVTLTANEAATIYYTTNGTTPTTSSTVYSGPITISATTTLKFFAKDTAGNSSVVTTKTYAIDKNAPIVSSADPAAGAKNITINKTVTVTFSENIIAGAYFNNIVLKDNLGKVISATKTISGRALKIDPGADLLYGKTYALTIPIGAVKDAAGNGLKTEYKLSFSTPANYTPAGGTVSPASGGAKAGTATTFTATFTDSNGFADISNAYFLLNTGLTTSKGIYVYYNRAVNKIYLRNDSNTAWLGGVAPGSTSTISNSYVTVNAKLCTASGSGNTLTLKINITPKATLAGKTLYSYLKAQDRQGAISTWKQKTSSWKVN